MNSILLTSLVLFGISSFFFGKSRIKKIATSGSFRPKALPHFYGYYQALWCALPAFLILILWTILEPIVVKNLIDKDNSMSAEDKAIAHSQLKELYALEVSDRDSARKREASVRVHGIDWMFNLTGLVGLASFTYLVYTIINVEVPETNKELFIHLIGIVEGVALSIFSYFFGQSIRKDN